MTGNINQDCNKFTYSQLNTESTTKRKRGGDEEEDVCLTQEIQDEKDLSNEAGLETLAILFQSLKLSKLSSPAQKIIQEIGHSLSKVNMTNAKELCFTITNLLEAFCSVTSYESYPPEEQRTVDFMHRACQKAFLLCQQGHFSPSVARETYFKLLLEEFRLDNRDNISSWLRAFLTDSPFHKTINTAELLQLGWKEQEIFLLIKHSPLLDELDLSGTPNIDFSKITLHETLSTLSFSSQQNLTKELFKKISETCLYLVELNIDTVNNLHRLN